MGKLCLKRMAKSKNHTNHNQTYKAHRNGIKKPLRERYTSLKRTNSVYRRNLKRARKFDPSIKKEKNLEQKILKRIDKKAEIQKRIKAAVVAKKLAVAKGPVKPTKKVKAAAKKARSKLHKII